MEITSVLKTTILAALLILLTACGESNEVYVNPNGDNLSIGAVVANETNDPGVADADSNTNTPPGPAPADGTADSGDTGTVDSGNSDTDTAGSGTIDASTPDDTAELQPTDGTDIGASGLAPTQRAQFVISDCGSVPMTTAVQSNTISAPTAMMVGQLVSGIIGPGADTTNNEHYWRIALEPGHYHVVLDTERVDGALSNLGLKLADVQDTGEVELFTDDEIDYRLRSHGFFKVEEARTLILRLTSNNDAEAYTFGIFSNGSAVPSPLFHDCPTIRPISVNTAEAVILPEDNSSTDDRWFVIDLPNEDYVVNSQGTRIDGLSSPVQYEFNLLDQFGQNGRNAHISYTDEAGPVGLANTDHLKSVVPAPVWIRIQNYNSELDMRFTISSKN